MIVDPIAKAMELRWCYIERSEGETSLVVEKYEPTTNEVLTERLPFLDGVRLIGGYVDEERNLRVLGTRKNEQEGKLELLTMHWEIRVP